MISCYGKFAGFESKNCGIRNVNSEKPFDPFRSNQQLLKTDVVGPQNERKFLADQVLVPPGGSVSTILHAT